MTKTTKPNTAQPEERLLTEEEIRAMSDDDYMNPAQLAFFKNRLQELEKELLKNAGETTEHLRETVLVPDPADRATIEEEHALERHPAPDRPSDRYPVAGSPAAPRAQAKALRRLTRLPRHPKKHALHPACFFVCTNPLLIVQSFYFPSDTLPAAACAQHAGAWTVLPFCTDGLADGQR